MFRVKIVSICARINIKRFYEEGSEKLLLLPFMHSFRTDTIEARDVVL